MRIHLIVLALALLPLAAVAQTYRWVDENGRVNFTQVPPKTGPYTVIGGAPPPAAAPNQESLNQSLDQERDSREEQRLAAEKKAAEQAQRQERCRKAIEQLAYLEGQTARRMASTNEQGEVVRDTEEQFEQRLTGQRELIKENCN